MRGVTTARDLPGACLAVAVLLAACSSGRAAGDASTTGNGGAGGSAGTSGGGGRGGASGSAGTSGGGGSGGGLDGGVGGVAGNAATDGGGGGGGGGGGTVSGDAGTTPCGDAGACAAGQVCMLSVTGGASYVCPDAGHVTFPSNCDGLIVDMYGCCYGAESVTYHCASRPSGCGATVTCACGASTLCASAPCSELGAGEIACWHVGT